MRVTIIATGFDKNVEGNTTVEAPVATPVAAPAAAPAPAPAPTKEPVRPGVAIGRADVTPTPVTPVAPAPVVQPAPEAAPAPKKDEGTISDDDFNDIMDILRKSKGRSDFRRR